MVDEKGWETVALLSGQLGVEAPQPPSRFLPKRQLSHLEELAAFDPLDEEPAARTVPHRAEILRRAGRCPLQQHAIALGLALGVMEKAGLGEPGDRAELLPIQALESQLDLSPPDQLHLNFLDRKAGPIWRGPPLDLT